MLGFLFGFHVRLGRMHYFLVTIALAIVMTAICFAIATYLIQLSPADLLSPASLMTWPTIAAMVFFAWVTFTLQSMRIRDIGWDPVCVIPAWIAILVIDNVVAGKIPAWSVGQEHNGTVVGKAGLRRNRRGTPCARVRGPGRSPEILTPGGRHTFSKGTSILLFFSSHSGTGRFFERMNSGLNSFD